MTSLDVWSISFLFQEQVRTALKLELHRQGSLATCCLTVWFLVFGDLGAEAARHERLWPSFPKAQILEVFFLLGFGLRIPLGFRVSGLSPG